MSNLVRKDSVCLQLALVPGMQPLLREAMARINEMKPEPVPDVNHRFLPGDRVKKTGGDYVFFGEVVAVFRKKSGAVRYIVENKDGVVHIFSGSQLTIDLEPTDAVASERHTLQPPEHPELRTGTS